MGQLIARFRTQEKAERRREERTTALYLLTRELADAVTLDQIVKVVVEQVGKLFNAEVAVLLAGADGQLSARARPAAPWPVGKGIRRRGLGLPAQPARRPVHRQPPAFRGALSSPRHARRGAGRPRRAAAANHPARPRTKKPARSVRAAGRAGA